MIVIIVGGGVSFFVQHAERGVLGEVELVAEEGERPGPHAVVAVVAAQLWVVYRGGGDGG